MSASERKEPQDIEQKVQTTVYDASVDVSDVDEEKLVRKIDWRLLPWLSSLFLLSFLDRASIGNAKVCTSGPLSRGNLSTFERLSTALPSRE